MPTYDATYKTNNYHAMETYRGCGFTDLRILNLGTKQRWVISSRPGRFNPRQKRRYLFDGRLGGPQPTFFYLKHFSIRRTFNAIQGQVIYESVVYMDFNRHRFLLLEEVKYTDKPIEA